MALLRTKYVVEDWRAYVQHRKAKRRQHEQHRLAGLRAMRVCGAYKFSPRSSMASPFHALLPKTPRLLRAFS